jgi:hypothetical protein
MSVKGCIDMKANPHIYHTLLTDLLEFACIYIYIYKHQKK